MDNRLIRVLEHVSWCRGFVSTCEHCKELTKKLDDAIQKLQEFNNEKYT